MDKTTTTTTRASAAEPPDRPIRVSLREIREAGFRALSAIGASPGEASTAAQMVLDAELQEHEGISMLIRDLERGPWVRDKVDLAETDAEVAPTTRLGTAATNRLLQHAPLAVDLAAAELDSGGVFLPGPVSGMRCLDTILIEVAQTRRCSVGVWAIRPRGAGAVRVARADGALGFATVTSDISTAGFGDGVTGLWVCAPAPQSWQQGALTWVSAEQRANIRAVAAGAGCLVEAARWRPVYAASRDYLVG